MQQDIQNSIKLGDIDEAIIDFSKFKCIKGNKAIIGCIAKDCCQPALLCSDMDQCECLKPHSKCYSQIVLSQIKKKCNKNRQERLSFKQKHKCSINVYKNIINQMIDQLSKMKDQLYAYQEQVLITKGQKKFIKIIEQGKYTQINSLVIKNLFEKQQLQVIKSYEQVFLFAVSNKKIFSDFCSNIKNNCFKTIKSIKLISSKQQKRIQEWLSQSTKKTPKSLTLLYRASQNEFSVQKFHQKCDQHNNLLLILKNQFNKTIGGFTPLNWKCEEIQFKKDESCSSFIFSLNMNQKFDCLDYERSILCRKQYGPTFGGYYNQQKKLWQSCDIFIYNKANLDEKSFGQFPTNYNKRLRGYKETQDTITLFTGNSQSSRFKIKQWEIYQVEFLEK